MGRFLQTDPIGYEDQMNLYAYVRNDPLRFTDPSGRIAIYFNGQGAFQLGGFGGRISIAAGIDTKKKTAFVAYSSGGSTSDITVESNEANGVQLGIGFGVGAASSSDFVAAPAYTTDVDIVALSGSVATNDPLIDSAGSVSDGSPRFDFSRDSSGGSGSDTTVRQLEVGVGGLGVGGATVKTEGKLAEISLKQRPIVLPPEEVDVSSSFGNPCDNRVGSDLC